MIRVFYGADTYRSRLAFRAAREDAERKTGGGAVMLRDEGLSPHAFQAAVEGQPLFGVAPPIAVERLTAFSGTQAEQIAGVVVQIPRDRAVFIWEDGVPPAAGIVWRTLESAADERAEFRVLSETEVVRWVTARAGDARQNIEPTAVRELYAACGADLWSLSSELEKLFLLKPKGVLTAADVREVTSSPPLADVFGAVDAIVQRDGGSALRRLATSRRAGEDLRRLFSLVLRDLRRLLRIRDGLDRGESLSPSSLAGEFHMPRSAAAALLRTARRATVPLLRSFIDRLVVAYYHLNSGRAEAGEVLESFILRDIHTSKKTSPRSS